MLNETEPQEYGSGSGTTRGYVVEARLTGSKDAEMVNGVLLTRSWKRLPLIHVEASAPIEARRIAVPSIAWPRLGSELGLLERSAAYAMAVRFQVDSGDDDHGGYSAGHAVTCVETRLVEVKLTWSYETEEVGVCEPLSLFEYLRFLKSAPRDGSPGQEP